MPAEPTMNSLRRFAAAVQEVAPNATGAPISTSASADTIVEAFLQAGAYSAVVIILLLAVVLRRARDVVLAMLPALLSGLLTFATCGTPRPAAQFYQHHRPAPSVRRRRRFQHLLRHGLALGRDGDADVEPDARRGLQRAGDRQCLRRALAVDPSGHGQHGPAADDRARLGAPCHLVVPTGPARTLASGRPWFQGSWWARPLWPARQPIARAATPEPARATPIN